MGKLMLLELCPSTARLAAESPGVEFMPKSNLLFLMAFFGVF